MFNLSNVKTSSLISLAQNKSTPRTSSVSFRGITLSNLVSSFHFETPYPRLSPLVNAFAADIMKKCVGLRSESNTENNVSSYRECIFDREQECWSKDKECSLRLSNTAFKWAWLGSLLEFKKKQLLRQVRDGRSLLVEEEGSQCEIN